MRKLLILTEAGDGIGYGHYTRCHSIYSEVLERKNSATLLVFQQGENAMVSDPTVQIGLAKQFKLPRTLRRNSRCLNRLLHVTTGKLCRDSSDI